MGGTPELTSTYLRPAVRPITRVRRAQAGARPAAPVLTNFGAILLTELIVMAIYRVRATAVQELGAAHGHPRLAAVVVVAFVVVLAAPLAVD